VISVLGVAEVVGFTEEQWKVVVVVLLPFVFLTVFYMRNFLKNFNKRDKKTNK
jgi:membrane protein implicated in regulation of membrane protease activity